MTTEITLSDLKRMNLTQIILGSKKVKDSFISVDEVKKAITINKNILDEYESDKGSVSDYDLLDDKDEAEMEVFDTSGHSETKEFEVHMVRSQKEDKKFKRVTKIEFVRDNKVEKQIFIE